jgi:hypothetical protein
MHFSDRFNQKVCTAYKYKRKPINTLYRNIELVQHSRDQLKQVEVWINKTISSKQEAFQPLTIISIFLSELQNS